MKKVAGLLLALLSLTSCEKEPATLSGTADGVYNGMRVYLREYTSAGSPVVIDTAVVMNGTFDFGIVDPIEVPHQRILQIDGISDGLLFIAENEPTQIIINKDSIVLSQVNAGPENVVFDKYKAMRLDHGVRSRNMQSEQQQLFYEGKRSELDKSKADWINEEAKFEQELKDFVTNNNDKAVAAIALEYLFQRNYTDEVETRELYAQLDDKVKTTADAMRLDQRLQELERVSIGKKAPYFEGASPDGSTIKLTESLGKVTLIDFWASWCKPCRVENPNLVDAYKEYHPKGFNILSVSLDQPGADEKWKVAIAEDQLKWKHISRLKGWDDPIAALYNVKAIPASFLVDENGVIIDKNLRGPALKKRLAELLD